MIPIRVFYSWQSDLPNNTNRSFIENALKDAAKGIQSDNSLNVEPVIDRDTLGVSGAPNIAEVILQKIDQSQVFVADVTIINSGTRKRRTPNPNVVFELGYAMARLGSQHLILVFNTAYGKVEQLPFDLKMQRNITYSVKDELDKTLVKKDLSHKLRKALHCIITNKDHNKYTPIDFFITDKDAVFAIVQNLSARQYFNIEDLHRVIKSKTSLYEQQRSLFIDFLIDHDYIKITEENKHFYTLGENGRRAYLKLPLGT